MYRRYRTISIHALVKRATRNLPFELSILLHFNPRPREEGDLLKYVILYNSVCISIHALVKRATTDKYKSKISDLISIHALVKRATAFPVSSSRACNISIHALVKRATKPRRICIHSGGYFNPRPREEGDTLRPVRYIRQSISIHALVKRATYRYTCKCIKQLISIHALMKRATKYQP